MVVGSSISPYVAFTHTCAFSASHPGNGAYTGVQCATSTVKDDMTAGLAVMRKVMNLFVAKKCKLDGAALKRARDIFRGKTLGELE